MKVDKGDRKTIIGTVRYSMTDNGWNYEGVKIKGEKK
jgi:hypothetical protein